MKSSYLLTVVIPAYNAEKYIAETLDSIVNQKTNFEFSILVSDDCSTDSTYAICMDYKARFPFIEVIKQEQNLGMAANQHFVVTKPQTKYIAYIDSDDLFACDNYLQQQFDFMEKHETCAVVFTNVEVFSETGLLKKRFNAENKPPTIFDLTYYFERVVPICNSSTVFRYSMTNFIPLEYSEYIQFDWLLHIHHGLRGHFGYNDFVGVKYRVHTDNSTNPKNTERLMLSAIKLVYSMHRFVPSHYQRFFTHPRYEINSLALHYLSQRRILDFLKWYFKWLKVTPFPSVNWRDQFYLFRQALFNR